MQRVSGPLANDPIWDDVSLNKSFQQLYAWLIYLCPGVPHVTPRTRSHNWGTLATRLLCKRPARLVLIKVLAWLAHNALQPIVGEEAGGGGGGRGGGGGH